MTEPATKRIWIYGLAAFAMLAAYAYVSIESDHRPRGDAEDILALAEREDLNVLFILVDTLRSHRLASYGYERTTSPQIDALAETGVRFSRHVSQSSWTKSSMASLWTAIYPNRNGVLHYSHGISEEATLPAEIFKAAGYETTAVFRNGWVAPNFGFAQGFDFYFRPKSEKIPASVRRDNPSLTAGGSDQDVVKSAIEFLRASADEQWFLYLHFMDVHQYVYDESTAVFGTSYTDIYDQSILWTDRLVGVVVKELEARGLRDRTLIVLTSDHGEAFGEHGREGHAFDVHAETTEVPFIVSFPFRLVPGVVVESQTGNIDVWPTILDLLGLPAMPDTDGRSVVDEIVAAARNQGPIERDRAIYAQIDPHWGRSDLEPDPTVAVTEGKYRLFHRPSRPDADRLFDHSDDPTEQTDVASEEADVTAQLRGRIDHYLETPPVSWGAEAPNVEIDDMELNQLRALGYAIE